MAVTVRFPTRLHTKAGREVVIDEPVGGVADLMTVLDHRIPGPATELSDPIFNVAVNDEMLLHGVRARSLADGDVVEFVPMNRWWDETDFRRFRRFKELTQMAQMGADTRRF